MARGKRKKTNTSNPDGGGDQPKKPTIWASRFKTKNCEKFEETGECGFGHKCMFAHGSSDLRSKESNFLEGLITEEAIRIYQETRWEEAKTWKLRSRLTGQLEKDGQREANQHAAVMQQQQQQQFLNYPTTLATLQQQNPLLQSHQPTQQNQPTHMNHLLQIATGNLQPQYQQQQQQQQQYMQPPIEFLQPQMPPAAQQFPQQQQQQQSVAPPMQMQQQQQQHPAPFLLAGGSSINNGGAAFGGPGSASPLNSSPQSSANSSASSSLYGGTVAQLLAATPPPQYGSPGTTPAQSYPSPGPAHLPTYPGQQPYSSLGMGTQNSNAITTGGQPPSSINYNNAMQGQQPSPLHQNIHPRQGVQSNGGGSPNIISAPYAPSSQYVNQPRRYQPIQRSMAEKGADGAPTNIEAPNQFM